MPKQFMLSKTFPLLATASLLAEVVVTIWAFPSQAATLAFSQLSTQLNNFSHKPDVTQTYTDTKTSAISSTNSSSSAIAQAEADFFVEPTLATNNILSSAAGEGNNYFGSAQSEAQVIGNFTVRTGEIFSFDFLAAADSLTWKDDSSSAEFVNSSGELSLLLVDALEPNVIYDSLSLSFNTQDPSVSNYLNLQSSNNFSIANNSLSNNFTQTGNIAKNVTVASVRGSFNHQFEKSTTITLKEYKKNQVMVQVPEAEPLLGSVCFLLLIGIKYKGNKRISI